MGDGSVDSRYAWPAGELLPYCARAAPDEVSDICRAAARFGTPTTDALGPAVLAVGRADAVRGLRLLGDLADSGLEQGMYANYHIKAIASELVNPYYHGPSEQRSVCALLQEWLQAPCLNERSAVVVAALEALFARAMRWSESDRLTVTWFERALPAVPERLSIRRQAVHLLGEMLQHPYRAARLGSETAGRLLTHRPLDPLANAYRYSTRHWFFSFDEVLASAPKDQADRHSWWVHTTHNMDNKRRDCERVVDELCSRYSGVEGILRCASALASTNNPAPILDAWCRREMDAFLMAEGQVKEPGARARIVETLRRQRYWANPDTVLDDFAALPDPRSFDEVDALLNSVPIQTPGLAVAIGRCLAEESSLPLRERGLEVIASREDAKSEAIFDVVECALRDGDWTSHWPSVVITLRAAGRWAFASDRVELRRLLEDRLLDGEDALCSSAHYEREILDMLYGGDLTRRLELVGRLLVRRPEAGRRVGELVVPLTKDPSQFRFLTGKMVAWMNTLGAYGFPTLKEVLAAALEDREPTEGVFVVASQMLEGSGPHAQAVALVVLSEMRSSPRACALIANTAARSSGELQRLAELGLRSFSKPRDWWIRELGKPAPAFVALHRTLEESVRLASPGGRRRINGVLAQVKAHMASEQRRDEEDLAPR